ncbi:hypothetical protein [Candidatus Electrothrix sp.]|uniref:hypothetical protein n=1 Tax=Candidatus Electrothrix sp. TaxID=2170559 RepID=UPI004057893A
MNTEEKIRLAGDLSCLYLHKEGIFYKVYNKDAMLFIGNIKPLKITAKFIKVVDQYVYSAGFPESVLERVKEKLHSCGGVFETAEKMLKVTGVRWNEAEDYSDWCGRWKGKAEERHEADSASIAQQVAAFPVMQRTPMEAVQFIISMQKQLNTKRNAAPASGL